MNPCHFRKISGNPIRAITNKHLALSAKRTGIKEDKGSLLYSCCGWQKGTSWDEVIKKSSL